MELTLYDVLMNAPLFEPKRTPYAEYDFGDEATVGLHVKISGKGICDAKDHDFGIYLGEYKGKFHVGTSTIMDFVPSRLESFDSLEELKMKWVLD